MAGGSKKNKNDLNAAWAEFLKKESDAGVNYDNAYSSAMYPDDNAVYNDPNMMYTDNVYNDYNYDPNNTSYTETQDYGAYTDASSDYAQENMNYGDANLGYTTEELNYTMNNNSYGNDYNNTMNFNSDDQGMNLGGYTNMAANTAAKKQEKSTTNKGTTKAQPKQQVKQNAQDKDTKNNEQQVEAKEETKKQEETKNSQTIDIQEAKSKPKKEKKDKKDKRDAQIEELQEKVMRNMAEFDNYRKRTEKEKAMMFEVGARSIIEKILPVIDNFERGLDAVSDEEKDNAFVQGIDKIYKQFVTTLEEAGVKPIEATGQEFNPDYHNAVMHIDDDSLGDNIVAEEFQKGYTYRDTVVRHSMVKVAN